LNNIVSLNHAIEKTIKWNKIFNENGNEMTMEEVKPESTMISILDIHGIKFTARNFQMEIELKQSMVVSPDPFLDACLIRQSNSKPVMMPEENISNIVNKILETRKNNVEPLQIPELKIENSFIPLAKSEILETTKIEESESILKPSLLDFQPDTNELMEFDLNIHDNLETISLKDPKGDYVYNGGTLKFIKQSPDKNIYFDEDSFIKDDSLTKKIVEITGVNPEKIADGLENNVKQEGIPSQWENITDYDGQKIINFLRSSYGYGYYYVRQIKPGELYIKDINQKEDIDELIGEVTNVKVKYPSVSSKSCEVRVTTNSPEGGETIYQIDMRNSAGGILPSLKVKSINRPK
jgi:hypothetical protein